MGNALVASSGETLATVAMAKYLKITREQIVIIRDTLSRYADRDYRVDRQTFQISLDKAQVRTDPDQKVLHHLFTMWDDSAVGKDRILYHDLVVGLSPLACPGENLSSVLAFTLSVMDEQQTGKISSIQLLFMLKSKCDNNYH